MASTRGCLSLGPSTPVLRDPQAGLHVRGAVKTCEGMKQPPASLQLCPLEGGRGQGRKQGCTCWPAIPAVPPRAPKDRVGRFACPQLVMWQGAQAALCVRRAAQGYECTCSSWNRMAPGWRPGRTWAG